nr:DUF2637 domain-containing protein [Kitasatospora paracochleata]
MTKLQKTLIGSVAGGAVTIAAIGFAGSYRAVTRLALAKDFGRFAYVFPIGIDAGIGVLLALDLLLTWLRIPFAPLRYCAWFLTGATVAFNAAAAWGDGLAVGMHAAIPVLFVIVVEAARHAVGRIADIVADRSIETPPWQRWILSPVGTFAIWRRQRLWQIPSYLTVIDLERELQVFRAQLRKEFGYFWRWKAPADKVLALALARFGISVSEALAMPKAEAEAQRKAEAAREAEAQLQAEVEAEALRVRDQQRRVEAEARRLAEAEAEAKLRAVARAEELAEAEAEARRAEIEQKRLTAEAEAELERRRRAEQQRQAEAEAEQRRLQEAADAAQRTAEAEAEALRLLEEKLRVEEALRKLRERPAVQPKPKPEPEADPKPEPEAEADPKRRSEAEAEVEPKSKPEPEANPKPGPEVEAEAVGPPNPNPKRPESEAGPKPKRPAELGTRRARINAEVETLLGLMRSEGYDAVTLERVKTELSLSQTTAFDRLDRARDIWNQAA